uniref:Uncharacterized protein n=1 Tax=Rhizophora mucronata TaxID=61149 RepID=A0A2P2Q4K2_RHIMU
MKKFLFLRVHGLRQFVFVFAGNRWFYKGETIINGMYVVFTYK